MAHHSLNVVVRIRPMIAEEQQRQEDLNTAIKPIDMRACRDSANANCSDGGGSSRPAGVLFPAAPAKRSLGTKRASSIRPTIVGSKARAPSPSTTTPPHSRKCAEPAPTATATDTSPTMTTFGAFSAVVGPECNNEQCYQAALAQHVPKLLQGENVGIFCYGHTGTGKTHTLVGYGSEHGMISRVVQDLFEQLNAANLLSGGAASPSSQDNSQPLVRVSFNELYNDRVFDLLSTDPPRQVRFPKVDADGNVKLRAAAEKEDGEAGNVWFNGVTTVVCTTAAEVQHALQTGLKHRSHGVSNLHAQSSRSHALFEIELVTSAILSAEAELREAEAHMVPMASKRDTAKIMFEGARYVQDPSTGKYIVRGEDEIPPHLADDYEAAEKALLPFTAKVEACQEALQTTIKAAPSFAKGSMVFADLAGAESSALVASSSSSTAASARMKTKPLQQSATELKEAREINTSLLALKECIRALQNNNTSSTTTATNNSNRIPFRNSKLTMLLKRYLSPSSSSRADTETTTGNHSAATLLPTTTTVVISTICQAVSQHTLCRSTLTYAQLLSDCAAK